MAQNDNIIEACTPYDLGEASHEVPHFVGGTPRTIPPSREASRELPLFVGGLHRLPHLVGGTPRNTRLCRRLP